MLLILQIALGIVVAVLILSFLPAILRGARLLLIGVIVLVAVVAAIWGLSLLPHGMVATLGITAFWGMVAWIAWAITKGNDREKQKLREIANARRTHGQEAQPESSGGEDASAASGVARAPLSIQDWVNAKATEAIEEQEKSTKKLP